MNGSGYEVGPPSPLSVRKAPVKLICKVILGLLPLLVACSPASASRPTTASGAASTSPQQLTVTAMDTMRFDPATLTARAGQPIQVTLRNSGQLPHDFDITEGVAQPVKVTAQPGQTAIATFTIDKPGTYTYFCSHPGHEQAGMKGTLTVQ
jgi:nitrite reductase (NO-forming)